MVSNFITLTLKKGGAKAYINADNIASVYPWEVGDNEWYSGTYVLMKGSDYSLVVHETPEAVLELIGKLPCLDS